MTIATAASSRLPCRPLRSSSSESVEDGDGIAISSSSSSEEEETPLSLAMAVGVVSSLVGFAYSKCMKAGFKLLWKTVPSSLLLVGGGGGCAGGCCPPNAGFAALVVRRYPAAYIPIVVTLGGSTVATLSTLLFPKLFSAHDVVRILSGGGEDGRHRADVSLIPSARAHLLPVAMMCCLTSVSGFSLGPEAPMVRARPTDDPCTT